MPSPITGFAEGTFGAMRIQHEPIRRAMEEVPVCGCRVIMQDGKFTREATREDRRLVRAKDKAPAISSTREVAGGTHQRKGRGPEAVQ